MVQSFKPLTKAEDYKVEKGILQTNNLVVWQVYGSEQEKKKGRIVLLATASSTRSYSVVALRTIQTMPQPREGHGVYAVNTDGRFILNV